MAMSLYPDIQSILDNISEGQIRWTISELQSCDHNSNAIAKTMRNQHVSNSIHLGDERRQRFETLSPTWLISKPLRLSCIPQSSSICFEPNNIKQYQLATRPP